MYPIRDVVGQELHWAKPKRSRLQFELRAGETIVATLAWVRGSRALGEWAGGQYHFSREGWLRPRVAVREGPPDASQAAGAPDAPVAMFTSRAGALTFADGRGFQWNKPKRWTSERIWVGDAGTELVRCRPERAGAAVAIQPAAAPLPELPLLLLLGQYLIVMAAQDAAAATTAAMVPIIGSGG